MSIKSNLSAHLSGTPAYLASLDSLPFESPNPKLAAAWRVLAQPNVDWECGVWESPNDIQDAASYQLVHLVRQALDSRSLSVIAKGSRGDSFLGRALAIMQKVRSRVGLPLAFVETFNCHTYSHFCVFLDGAYFCDAIEPSLHRGLASWAVGGRGGVPSGLYWLRPYFWKDKQKHIWELAGDNRRGAILVHSGNTVVDSKGCFVLGVPSGSPAAVQRSVKCTKMLWAYIASLNCLNSVRTRSNNALILRKSVEY